MTVTRLVIAVAILLGCGAPPGTAVVGSQRDGTPRERPVAAGKASLFVRDIGHGPPIVVVHGGPDFDHSYLLPEVDRLSDKYHLIYYDQRGRGKSAGGVQPEERMSPWSRRSPISIKSGNPSSFHPRRCWDIRGAPCSRWSTRSGIRSACLA